MHETSVVNIGQTSQYLPHYIGDLAYRESFHPPEAQVLLQVV